MKTPKLPANEAARLEALRSYEVLDTAPERSFDGITRLAAELLEVPIALVTLVDADRQWFKSCHGLPVRETSRAISFCGHVVADDAALVVLDARTDPRFHDNPLVLGEPQIRFYVGVPLRTPGGLTLGTLCAIDREPRALSPDRLELLAVLAEQVVDQLEARRERLALEGERRQLRALLAAMVEGVVLQDRDGHIRECNGAAERILGLTRDQMEGRTSLDPRWRCIHEDGTPFPGDTHPAMVTLATGLPQRDVVMGVHKPDGSLTWILVSAVPLARGAGDAPYAVVATFHDITEMKAAAAAAEVLARQERLVTTGTLAAGVGHEINNPLAFVVTNLEHATAVLRAEGPRLSEHRAAELVQVLTDAREGAERIRKIVRGLKAFARPESEPVPTRLESVVDSSVQLALHELRHRATLVREMDPTLVVLADEARLVQVLVNLLVNAAQSFTSADSDRNRIVVRASHGPEGYVTLEIEDNGPGIPAGVRARIFDPFFTTKPVGTGTGLGLYIASGIVDAHGGTLSVESVEGERTTFRVVLPAVASKTRPPEARRPRVLVVDDEPLILRAMERALRDEVDVVAVGDSTLAWKRIEGGERFDVVVSDLMMSPLSGEELYRRTLEVDPGLARRFAFITGAATAPAAASFFAHVPNEWLEKPFVRADLLAMIERTLARAAEGG
jgi:PAS domain S-box-containing protein